MTSAVLSPRAAADLDHIRDHGATRRGVDQAERYARDPWRGIAEVAIDPGRGRPCPEVREGYFRHAVRSHVVFYRVVVDGIDVVRILHARMDFERHLQVARAAASLRRAADRPTHVATAMSARPAPPERVDPRGPVRLGG